MKKPSLKIAIENNCKECIYDGASGSGTWREQVSMCTSKECSFYDLRPLREGLKHEWQEEGARKYAEGVLSGKITPLKGGNHRL
jgi:hypothetical protein